MTNQERECVYCGARGSVTSDHIPPKNLFAEPRPSNLWTVPACRQCNSAASKDDEYFKTVLTLKTVAGDHPDAKVASQSVLRALGRPNAQAFSRSFLDRVHDAPVISPVGIYIGKRPAYHVDLSRLDRVVVRVVKGLFHILKRRRLVECVVASFSEEGLRHISATVKEELQRTVVVPALAGIHGETPNQVMRYWVSFDPDDDRTSAWILEFYLDVRFLVFVLPEPNTRKPS